MWGRILDFDGRPDEAVTAWEASLTSAESDFPLLMSIGEIRHRQGNDGPTVVYRRGMVSFNPSTNEAEEEKYKRSLEEAASVYAKARTLRPGEIGGESSGKCYSAQQKHAAAAEIWRSLVEQEPNNDDYRLSLALAFRKAGRTDEALQHLKQAIELNPRLAEAHEALAEIQKEKGQTAAAGQSQRKAEFYRRLPPFCTLVYSEDNVKTLDGLDRAASVRKLLIDSTARTDEFLAVVCWSHPHNALETEAFQALEARGAENDRVVACTLDDARSTCTIKSTAHILARRKAEGLFDFLVKMLPGDTRGLAMDMDIAGSLDDLGDPRAVGPLVEVLNPGDAHAAEEHGPLIDRTLARARAALALGAFDTPDARRALEAGTHDPQSRALLPGRTLSAHERSQSTRGVGKIGGLRSGLHDLYPGELSSQEGRHRRSEETDAYLGATTRRRKRPEPGRMPARSRKKTGDGAITLDHEPACSSMSGTVIVLVAAPTFLLGCHEMGHADRPGF